MNDDKLASDVIELGAATAETGSKEGLVPEFIGAFTPALLSDD